MSSCCPQPTSEEVTGSCLTLSLQAGSCKEAEGQQDAGGLRGSLQAVMCQLDLCATGRVQESIAAHSFPTSSQQGSGHQVSMTSALPPHPKMQGRAPRAQGLPSGVLQAMTGDLPPQKGLPPALQPGPCSRVSRDQQGKSKTKMIGPFADLVNTLRCFVSQQSIHDHCSLSITGFPGACSGFFAPIG